MEIKTKFNIGDIVYYCEDFEIFDVTIEHICINIFKDKPYQILYSDNSGYTEIELSEKELYNSKDEVKEIFVQKIKEM
jgi:hypothetical protein